MIVGHGLFANSSINLPPFGIPPLRKSIGETTITNIRQWRVGCATVEGQLCCEGVKEEYVNVRKKRVFLLDLNSLCYNGRSRSLDRLSHRLELLFSGISKNDPVIAVFDGENGVEYRRRIIPSYKMHRLRVSSPGLSSIEWNSSFEKFIIGNLSKCNIPVLKETEYEADDTIASLAVQAMAKEHRVVIASSDTDFRQLINEDVTILTPHREKDKWCFYNVKRFRKDYRNCDPQSYVSIRCFLGDEGDGVPGIRPRVRWIGRKMTLRLMKRHGTLENLVSAAAVRRVGRAFVHEAVTKHVEFLRKNHRTLSLRTDAPVRLQDEWLCPRDTTNDAYALSQLLTLLS